VKAIPKLLAHHFRQLSVLVIEDNIDEHIIMHCLLRQYWQEVLPVGATTAKQALAYLRNCLANQQPLPDLILLDLYLPERDDCRQFLQRIRSQPIFKGLPVVILSRSRAEEDIEQSYRWGASFYLSKPANLDGWEEQFRHLRHYLEDKIGMSL
jgi:CheY-like chemotaxis protein